MARCSKSFPDGAFWITAGPEPNLPVLQTVLARLAGDRTAAYTDAGVGKASLSALYAQRGCLLVIDDVWDLQTLDALYCLGDRGVLLITTRDAGIARARLDDSHCIEVSGLEREQSLRLLAWWAKGVAPSNSFQLPPNANQICALVGDVALGVAICGGMIRARGGTAEAWQHVVEAVVRAEKTKIALQFPPDQYSHASLLSAIDVSLEALTVADRHRYLELAIFAGKGYIPPAAIEALWSLSPEETVRLLGELEDRSLAQRDSRGWLILHDLEYDVALSHLSVDKGRLRAAHRRLIEGYRSRCSGGGWAGGPNDGYFLQNLAYHLAASGHSEELDELLLDFDWIRRKVTECGMVALIADYDFGVPSASVGVLRRALRLSVPFVVAEPACLTGQIVGRLVGVDDRRLARLLDDIRGDRSVPWLCPVTPSLFPAEGPLERILIGHEGRVYAVAASLDGMTAISAGADGTVRIWDLATGLGRAHKAEMDRAFALAVTPDGTKVVAGGGEGGHGAVRIWDLPTGRLETTLEGAAAPVRAMAVAPDGASLVAGETSGAVRIWDLATGRLLRSLEDCPEGWVRALAVTIDGRTILTGADDGKVRVWDLGTGRLAGTLEGCHEGSVKALAVTPDGTTAVTGGRDRTLRNLGPS